MEGIRFAVTCNHIVSVARIPDLRKIQIAPIAASSETFHASPGNAAVDLANPRKWIEAIIIKQTDASCF